MFVSAHIEQGHAVKSLVNNTAGPFKTHRGDFGSKFAKHGLDESGVHGQMQQHTVGVDRKNIKMPEHALTELWRQNNAELMRYAGKRLRRGFH